MIDRIGSRRSVRALAPEPAPVSPGMGTGRALRFSKGLGVILGALGGRCRVTTAARGVGGEAGGHRGDVARKRRAE